MQIYYSYPEGWYAVIVFLLILWLSIFVYRKSYRSKKEIKQQITFSIIAVVIAFIVEFIAVSLEIWNYVPGNWPVILWPGYFIAALVLYQILRLLEKYFK